MICVYLVNSFYETHCVKIPLVLVLRNFIINVTNMVVMQTCEVETTMMPLDFCFIQ